MNAVGSRTSNVIRCTVVVEQQRTFDVSNREILYRGIRVLSAAEQAARALAASATAGGQRRADDSAQRKLHEAAAKPVPAPSIDLDFVLPAGLFHSAALRRCEATHKRGDANEPPNGSLSLRFAETWASVTAPEWRISESSAAAVQTRSGTGMPSCSSTDGWPAVKETPDSCCGSKQGDPMNRSVSSWLRCCAQRQNAAGRNGRYFWCSPFITAFGSLAVSADERDQAKRIHDRIAGVPPDAADVESDGERDHLAIRRTAPSTPR